MPTAPPALSLSIELSTNIYHSHTRERCPSIRFTLRTPAGHRDLGAIRSDVEKPRLDLPDGAVQEIDADDVLSGVIDEQAWLAELARVLAPGGGIRLTLPASGPLAWSDARNIYRYVTDILGRGNGPDSTFPTGWNRHYNPADVPPILEDAGFSDISIRRVGVGLAEPPQIAGLMIGNFLQGKRDTELRLHTLRQKMERLDTRIPLPGIGVHLAVTARRLPAEPDDPAADSAASNLPAPEIDHE